MKKLLIILIFVFIAINFILFYIDGKGSSDDKGLAQSDSLKYIQKKDTVPELDDFRKIDIALLEKNFDKKWIYSKKTDSLWFKYVKVPNEGRLQSDDSTREKYSLARYNLFFQKILRDNGIQIKRASEFELSNKLIYNFTVNDTIPATVELRITKGLESNISLSGNLCIIMYSMGDSWGQQWIKNLLLLPIPLTIAILPDRWASKTIYEESLKNSKEVLICLPMEPLSGNIDKDKFKILKGMNSFTINVILDKVTEMMPKAIGLINYKGSKAVSDYETMDSFFKSLVKRDLVYVENPTGGESFSELLSNEYGIDYISRVHYFDSYRSLKSDFQNIADDVLNGKDAIIVVDPTEDNYNFITTELSEKYPELNYLSFSQISGLNKW